MQEENKKSEVALREEKILEFWRENKTFQKTLKKDSPKGEYVFYDGPPTANGMPGIHHLIPQSFKDAIPRYRTMRGYHVRRKGGWDTHGLPVELLVEKELGLKSKKEIESYGIAKFNQKCRESVWKHVDVWYKFRDRVGYWVDKDTPYVTYHNDYIESLWNVVKKIDEQKLLEKDYKVVPWCPRCGTALSSHELAQGYEDVKDLSVYVKFKVKGKENTYLLAWTTTPWTLPGNVALAVAKDIDYVEVEITGEAGVNISTDPKIRNSLKDQRYILAKNKINLFDQHIQDRELLYRIVRELKGSDLVGLEYEPLFPYLKEQVEAKGESTEKAFKVYSADFVNTTDGTGIVHTAVMYGQDDFELGAKVGLPKFHLVNPEGNFIKGTGFLEGRFVKEKDENGKPTLAVDIIKYLTEKNLFFKKENYEHSYPHCWRCKTALIYYARDSWYVRMSNSKIKEKLISENKEINWEPSHIRDGRFGEWLREIKDWAISRERYWGTPLPVWICEKCGKKQVVGSLDELKKNIKKYGNKYFVMRHGEAENNAMNIYSSDQTKHHLTDKGKGEVLETIKDLKSKKITKIFCSPFLRTRETAEMVAEGIGFPKDQIVYDDRIRELDFGDFSGRPMQEYWDYLKEQIWTFDTKIPGGESFHDGKKRFGEFLYDIDKQNENETILVVSHGLSVELIPAIIEGANKERSLEIFHLNVKNKPAELHIEHEFISLPHNSDFELDFHRPFIDEVKLECGCGEVMLRTKEVMDVWFDSGAMPFAQDHYPFEVKEPLYPADFISEGIDQTRGWFYTLHAVGVLMGRGKAYKNVICLGHLLDAKGKKMSKSVGNVVDPWLMMDKYGVDTLRMWMYSVNQPGESKNFDEKTVVLLQQQVFTLLYNVLAFYELYRDKSIEKNEQPDSKNILDQWILSRLNGLVDLTEKSLDNYKLLEPVRAVRDFVGDLSTWYLRRSRERIKEGDKDAKETLYFVLKNLAKVMAPFAPFTAEDIWFKLRNENDEESVHLVSWPIVVAQDLRPEVLENMDMVRNIVTLGLEARQKSKIQVRQPLALLEIKNFELGEEYVELIKDEINVKEVKGNKNLESDVSLDIEITDELKQEGNYRELLRAVQDMRKKMGLTPSDVIVLSLETSEEGENLIQKFENDMKKVALASKIEFGENDGQGIKIDSLSFKVKIEK